MTYNPCSDVAPEDLVPASRKEWTLLALAAAEGRPLSPVQLQKVLFVFSREMPGVVRGAFAFKAYNYGPFDASICTDAEELEREGLVHIARSNRWTEYSATPAGMSYSAEIARLIDAQATVYLAQLVTWARGLSLNDLVRAIYARYPD